MGSFTLTACFQQSVVVYDKEKSPLLQCTRLFLRTVEAAESELPSVSHVRSDPRPYVMTFCTYEASSSARQVSAGSLRNFEMSKPAVAVDNESSGQEGIVARLCGQLVDDLSKG